MIGKNVFWFGLVWLHVLDIQKLIAVGMLLVGLDLQLIYLLTESKLVSKRFICIKYKTKSKALNNKILKMFTMEKSILVFGSLFSQAAALRAANVIKITFHKLCILQTSNNAKYIHKCKVFVFII